MLLLQKEKYKTYQNNPKIAPINPLSPKGED